MAAFPISTAVMVLRAVSWATDCEAAPGGSQDSRAGCLSYPAGPSAGPAR